MNIQNNNWEDDFNNEMAPLLDINKLLLVHDKFVSGDYGNKYAKRLVQLTRLAVNAKDYKYVVDREFEQRRENITYENLKSLLVIEVERLKKEYTAAHSGKIIDDETFNSICGFIEFLKNYTFKKKELSTISKLNYRQIAAFLFYHAEIVTSGNVPSLLKKYDIIKEGKKPSKIAEHYSDWKSVVIRHGRDRSRSERGITQSVYETIIPFMSGSSLVKCKQDFKEFKAFENR